MHFLAWHQMQKLFTRPDDFGNLSMNDKLVGSVQLAQVWRSDMTLPQDSNRYWAHSSGIDLVFD